MLILLSASEEQADPQSGRPMNWEELSFPELAPARAVVADVLARESARPYATGTLHVSPTLADEVARNTRLDSASAHEALAVYRGHTFQCLDMEALAPLARRRANRWVIAISALYGALHLNDRIAPYRLAMGSPLPEVSPLAAFWRSHLGPILTRAAGDGLIVDCRSTPYAAAWTPRGALASRVVTVRFPGSSAQTHRLRGSVARSICTGSIDPQSVPELADALGESLDVELVSAGGNGRSWALELRGDRRDLDLP